MKKLRLFVIWLLAIALLLPTVLAGCSTSTEGEKQPAETGEQTTGQEEQAENKPEQAQGTPTEFKEAPMLADRVKAGDLPPLEERLPKNPKLTNEMPADMLDYVK